MPYLITAIVLNWTTVQTNYTHAFAQAPLSEEIHMEIPKDFTTCNVDNDYVLCMNKSLYGLQQAPLSWFEHLKIHLESCGSEASSVDQCLFVNKKTQIFCLVYIDNIIWVAPD